MNNNVNIWYKEYGIYDPSERIIWHPTHKVVTTDRLRTAELAPGPEFVPTMDALCFPTGSSCGPPPGRNLNSTRYRWELYEAVQGNVLGDRHWPDRGEESLCLPGWQSHLICFVFLLHPLWKAQHGLWSHSEHQCLLPRTSPQIRVTSLSQTQLGGRMGSRKQKAARESPDLSAGVCRGSHRWRNHGGRRAWTFEIHT